MEYCVALSHQGIIRISHWIKSKNLPFSLKEVRKQLILIQHVLSGKTRFFQNKGTSIKASTPMEIKH